MYKYLFVLFLTSQIVGMQHQPLIKFKISAGAINEIPLDTLKLPAGTQDLMVLLKCLGIQQELRLDNKICLVDTCGKKCPTAVSLAEHILSSKHLNMKIYCPNEEKFKRCCTFIKHRPSCNQCRHATYKRTKYYFDPLKPPNIP